ncbi:MAG: MFS transporter [Bacteroidetes bacterium]|nr:MFS transporter [Bacteroidota bacterium]
MNKNIPWSWDHIRPAFNFTVLVASLGYFVDMYDLVLYGIVRIPSLKSLGITGDELVSKGMFLLNMQMIGMLIGGIIWGILGDKKGRLSVLFGSIALYSVANIANAFVTTVPEYAFARFFAGVGLAGELGAAITLVSEIMKKESRGYGTTIVASVGILGSVTAGLVGDYFTWQWAYIFGGLLGLVLLALRAKMLESGMFSSVKSNKSVKKGDFLSLFTNRKRFFKYLQCILIGLPMWFVVGILVMLSPEFAVKLGVAGSVSAGKSIMYCYAGLVLGDLLSGFSSQVFQSRKRIVLIFILLASCLIVVYLNAHNLPLNLFYALVFVMGISIGYWAVFVTIASEQFGTNLRSTVTTTVPNFVRGGVVLITLSFEALKGSFGLEGAAAIVGIITIVLALVSLWFMEETFNKDLDYLEPPSSQE